MKCRKSLLVLATLLICASVLFACGGRSMESELPGEWFVWHWYFNVDGGDNGFFEEARFYTFGADGSVTVTVEGVESKGTYQFTGKDTVDVTYEDGTYDSFRLIPETRDGVKQIQMMNVNTSYTLTLEPMSSWSE